jgi:hypothetical protein
MPVVAVLTPGLLLLAGCGSSSSGGSASAIVPIPSICTQISGVLGSGPDPDADPIGYAEAQIGPLAAVHTTKSSLQQAITALDAAFKQEFADHASSPSKAAVRKAQRQVNTYCPGAAS